VESLDQASSQLINTLTAANAARRAIVPAAFGGGPYEFVGVFYGKYREKYDKNIDNNKTMFNI
jgi:hypothetical protein